MPNDPRTSLTLLMRIRDASDDVAWRRFIDVYGPVVLNYALRHGLQNADAADVVQEVMCKVSAKIADFDYDPTRGRFLAWLYTLARNHVITRQRRLKTQHQGTGDSAVQRLMEVQTAVEDDEADWASICQQRVLDYAMSMVQSEFSESHWQAFYQTAVKNRKPMEVASNLGMKVGTLYVVKSRILARVKAVAADLSSEE
ncbi:MAG: RNA polymerase sigma factor [Planctomycetaceae bacterium]